MLVVFTIGHSTRTWKVFLDLLRAHGIKRVADVRSIPRSRHNPQFNRETMSMKLRSARVGYVHLRKLGGLRHARRDSPNMGWRNASFRGFADYMQTPDFDAGLERLIKLAKERKTVLMCAEAVPWRCHRTLIGDALIVRGIRVEHIMSESTSLAHSLTSFGHVRCNRVTYPLSKIRGTGSSNDGEPLRRNGLTELEASPMSKIFKRGDHVEWNSEAGRVGGVIVKKVVSAVRFKGYVHHASRDEPQYIIKSEKTDHVAIHKGQALKHIKRNKKIKRKTTKPKRKTS